MDLLFPLSTLVVGHGEIVRVGFSLAYSLEPSMKHETLHLGSYLLL